MIQNVRNGSVVVSLTVVAVFGLIACGETDASNELRRGETNNAPKLVQGDGVWSRQAESLQWWRDLADQVVVVEVLAESELRAAENETEGYRGRSITLGVVETIWSRHEALGRIELTLTGWQFDQKNGYTRLMSAAGTWPSIGSKYLLPLFRLPNGEWSTLDERSMVEIVDDELRPGSASPELAKTFDGTDIEEFRRLFLEVEPDPELEVFADYDPVTRLRLRDGSMSVATGSASAEHGSGGATVASTTTWPKT